MENVQRLPQQEPLLGADPWLDNSESDTQQLFPVAICAVRRQAMPFLVSDLSAACTEDSDLYEVVCVRSLQHGLTLEPSYRPTPAPAVCLQTDHLVSQCLVRLISKSVRWEISSKLRRQHETKKRGSSIRGARDSWSAAAVLFQISRIAVNPQHIPSFLTTRA